MKKKNFLYKKSLYSKIGQKSFKNFIVKKIQKKLILKWKNNKI